MASPSPSALARQVRSSTIRLAFDPEVAAARAASVAVRQFLAEQGVPEKELFPYELCVAEACYNAVAHAAGPARQLEPVAEALVTPDQVELRVTDHTAGLVLPEKASLPPARSEHGRGIFIIHSMMDEVRYLRGTGENVLIMRKRRRASQPAAPVTGGAAPGQLSLKESRRQLTESKTAGARLAGELLFASNTLSAIFRCCAELGRTDAVSDGFGRRLMADLSRLTTADWYILRLLSPDGRKLAVTAASAAEMNFEPLLLPANGAGTGGIEVGVAARASAVRFDLRDDRNPAEPLRAVGPEATGLACPLVFGGVLVGTIAVGRRGGDFPLGKTQDEVIRVFAEFLAIQTINLRHHKEELQNRVLGRELEIAQEIQLLLLPRTLPQPSGFSLAGGWHSARQVGGDFYDALAVGEHSVILMVADVMGKGVPAALFAATMRGLLRGLAMRSDDPAAILEGLNRLLYADLSAVNMFISAQVVHVDLRTRAITVASAGHCPPLCVTAGRHAVRAIPAKGFPIGVLPDTVYQSVSAVLGRPTTLLLHTDGVTDSRNAAGSHFGQHRLIGWLSANAISGQPAADLRDRLAAELQRFRGTAPMDDDQAFLLLTEVAGDPDAPGPVQLAAGILAAKGIRASTLVPAPRRETTRRVPPR